MKFRKRPARRKGASPGDNDLCHLCCCGDGDRVDNPCWRQDRYSSSWHLGRPESVSGPSAVASPAFGISLFCSGTKPAGKQSSERGDSQNRELVEKSFRYAGEINAKRLCNAIDGRRTRVAKVVFLHWEKNIADLFARATHSSVLLSNV